MLSLAVFSTSNKPNMTTPSRLMAERGKVGPRSGRCGTEMAGEAARLLWELRAGSESLVASIYQSRHRVTCRRSRGVAGGPVTAATEATGRRFRKERAMVLDTL